MGTELVPQPHFWSHNCRGRHLGEILDRSQIGSGAAKLNRTLASIRKGAAAIEGHDLFVGRDRRSSPAWASGPTGRRGRCESCRVCSHSDGVLRDMAIAGEGGK